MDEDILNNKILRHSVKALNYIGLTRFQNEKNKSLKNLICTLVLTIYVFYNIAQFIFLYQNRDDLALVIINGGTTILTILLYIRSFNYIKYRKQYNDLCTRMHDCMKFYDDNGDSEEKLIIETCVKRFTNIFQAVRLTIGSTCVLFVISHTLNFFVINRYVVL